MIILYLFANFANPGIFYEIRLRTHNIYGISYRLLVNAEISRLLRHEAQNRRFKRLFMTSSINYTSKNKTISIFRRP